MRMLRNSTRGAEGLIVDQNPSSAATVAVVGVDASDEPGRAAPKDTGLSRTPGDEGVLRQWSESSRAGDVASTKGRAAISSRPWMGRPVAAQGLLLAAAKGDARGFLPTARDLGRRTGPDDLASPSRTGLRSLLPFLPTPLEGVANVMIGALDESTRISSAGLPLRESSGA